jgi:hypothetical protein
VAYYEGWKTPEVDTVSPDTNWVVMCGQNGGTSAIYSNGKNVAIASGGPGNQQIGVNGGAYPADVSDWAIMEIAVWDRVLSEAEWLELIG